MSEVLIRFRCPHCGNEWFKTVEANSYNSAEYCLECFKTVEPSEEEVSVK